MAKEHKSEPSKSGGMGEEMKGKAKQAWGDMTDNPKKKMEGEREEAMGQREQTQADLQKERKERIE